MALLSYALTNVDGLLAYTGETLVAEELVSVYHDASASATAATVAISGGTLSLVITGGGNAGTDNIVLSTHATITALVAAINALAKGWVAAIVAGKGGADPTNLSAKALTSAYAQGAIQYLVGLNDLFLITAINAATELIERYCDRRFASTIYEHRYHGMNRRTINLRNYPVISVARVSVGSRKVMQITNASIDAEQALVSVDSDSMDFEVIGGASANTDSVSITNSTTLTNLIASINALGSNWSASLDGQADGAWLAANLYEFNGRQALNIFLDVLGAEESIDGYEVNAQAGILYRRSGEHSRFTSISSIRGPAFAPPELRPLTARSSGPVWPDGMFNIFVRYTAGFATIPDDLKFICEQVAANIMRMRKRDTGLASESIDGYSYSAKGDGPLTVEIKASLASHRLLAAIEFVEV